MNGVTLRNLITDRLRDVGMCERFVFLTLARHAYAPPFNVWPSQETIAAATGMSTRRVHTALAELEAKGYIARVGFRPVDHIPRARLVVYQIIAERLSRLPKPARDDRNHVPVVNDVGAPVSTLDDRNDVPAVDVAKGVDDRNVEARRPERECIDDRNHVPTKRSKKKRSGRDPRRARAREGDERVSFSPVVRELAEHHGAAYLKHHGRRPPVRDQELEAAREVLETHGDEARSFVEHAVALSVAQRVKGNASLIAIAADPAAFMAKPAGATKTNGLKQHAPKRRQPWQEDPAE